MRDEVQEGWHLITIEKPPLVKDIALGVHDAASGEGGREAKLTVEVTLHDVLTLLANALRLLLVRALQLDRGVGRVEARVPLVAQHTAFDCEAHFRQGEGHERRG